MVAIVAQNREYTVPLSHRLTMKMDNVGHLNIALALSCKVLEPAPTKFLCYDVIPSVSVFLSEEVGLEQ